VFFNPRVWHAGGANTTEKVRSGLTIYGVRSFMKPRLDFPRMIQPDVIEHQSERVKRILGFDTRVPTSMEEFYVPASERLYKGGQG
jgi:ectoine hydroxylase-related dioxygenase (phytanoyl-CoA dioxygenase family)